LICEDLTVQKHNRDYKLKIYCNRGFATETQYSEEKVFRVSTIQHFTTKVNRTVQWHHWQSLASYLTK